MTRPESVEISFGTMFTPLGEDGRIDVITDIREGETFSARRLFEDDQGKYLNWLSGTGDSQVFGQKVGQMNPDEVIEALNQGYLRVLRKGISEKQRLHLTELSKKAPRTITLK